MTSLPYKNFNFRGNIQLPKRLPPFLRRIQTRTTRIRRGGLTQPLATSHQPLATSDRVLTRILVMPQESELQGGKKRIASASSTIKKSRTNSLFQQPDGLSNISTFEFSPIICKEATLKEDRCGIQRSLQIRIVFPLPTLHLKPFSISFLPQIRLFHKNEPAPALANKKEDYGKYRP